jgi:hypothetical protein
MDCFAALAMTREYGARTPQPRAIIARKSSVVLVNG